MFCISFFVLLCFFFWLLCVVCYSSIYWFRLHIWYLQTLFKLQSIDVTTPGSWSLKLFEQIVQLFVSISRFCFMGPIQQFLSYNELHWYSSDLIDVYNIEGRLGVWHDLRNQTSQCSLTCRLGGTIKRIYHTLCIFDSIELVYYQLETDI